MIIFLRKWSKINKFGIFMIICCELLLFFMPTDFLNASENDTMLSLYSRSCALVDGDTGRVLYGKDEQTPMANASTTKILTCIVALEQGNMDDIVTASPKAASQPKVHLGMKEGEQFYFKDLLFALMLESYNDCAVALAEHIAGSTEAFADIMNKKAKELGCKDTYFITPNGLDDTDEVGFHHTTASDLCLIMKYCTWESPKTDLFRQITKTPSYSFQSMSGRNFSLTNRNAFLTMMDGVISGKTGFTADAGYCYVAALESEGRKYCIALLACGWPNNRTYKWQDAKELFSYGIENYAYQKSEQIIVIPPLVVTNGKKIDASLEDWSEEVCIQPVADYQWQLDKQYLLKESEKITYEIKIEKVNDAPIEKTTQVGTIFFFLKEECISKVPIYAGETIEKWTFKSLFHEIIKKYFLM